MGNSNASFSKTVKAGRTTFFVDIREAKNGNQYLSITESQINGEEKKKTSIRIFGETIEEFRKAIDEAAALVAGGA
jgi:hypothetical protein